MSGAPDFLTWLREDVTPWILGHDAHVAHERARALFDSLFRELVRQCLERYDAHRFAQAPLWARLTRARGSVTAPIWAAASRKVLGSHQGTLRANAHGDDVALGWQAASRRWPQPVAAAVDAAPADLRALLDALPTILASHALVALAGLSVAEGDEGEHLSERAGATLAALPHSTLADERALGQVLRRALWAAAWLGDLGAEPPAIPPASPPPDAPPEHLSLAAQRGLQALLYSHRQPDLDGERAAIAALEPVLRRLELHAQAEALCAHGVAAALKAGAPEEASAWLSHLAAAAEERADGPRALRLRRLEAATSRQPAHRGAALRQAAALAVELDQMGDALSLLRDEASVQDAAGEIRLAGLAWLNLAKVFFKLGEDLDAQASAAEAHRRLEDVGTLGLARQALSIRAEALGRLGRPTEAAGCLSQALELAEREEEHEVAEAIRGRIGG